MKHNWKKIIHIEGGHRYFRDENNGDCVAVADDSGPTPDLTNDGVLWLCNNSPVFIEHHQAIIMVTPDGKKKRNISEYANSGLLLAHALNLEIKIGIKDTFVLRGHKTWTSDENPFLAAWITPMRIDTENGIYEPL